MKHTKLLGAAKVAGLSAVVAFGLLGQQATAADENPFAALKLRTIGPALTSGRVSDFAFHKGSPQSFYLATSSGNLWKTSNNGTTWQALFENEGSYALGSVVIDPNNPETVWVGTGENNAQRSVANGDGIYKSVDGGKSWNNMGLRDSGHISQIWVDPNDSDTVLVASQGPLWNAGGDRGLYKTTDGGNSWNRILEIDEHTGVNEFVVDPRDSNNIVLSTYQRRRHVWVLINGGPGSGIQRTTDGGVSWQKVKSGLPSKDDMGRIGLAGAPSAPGTIYAIIEASNAERGVYRSDNLGITWRKQSNHMTTSPQYYNELMVDPNNADRVYSMDTFTNVSDDGGKNWRRLSSRFRHVDDHAMWIDPNNSKHMYIGGDGGAYESWDMGSTWRQVRNLPITQFYRIQPDNAEPFYNVCGGTQDNNSLCAPSRTQDMHGVGNEDWTIILGGDGYEPQIDPTDPNIIYTQYQYGGLARYDRRTGERVYIAPQAGSGENAPKWNWNTPLVISPHNSKRIYYASERVYRSDDRGDNWTAISPDLTQKIDRNTLEVMGRVWSVDAIAKNDSTSKYGSIIGFSESTLMPGLLYVGSDDGLISVSEDGGENWHQMKAGFPTIAVRDVEIQRRENDLVVGTFGRGVYILDDYSPLRSAAADVAAARATLFPVKNPWLYVEGDQYGNELKGSQGDEYYTAENPPFGAVFTYYLNESYQPQTDIRRKAERAIEKDGGDTPYPSWDALRAEDNEEAPKVFMTIRDAAGIVVRRLGVNRVKGLHRVAWDLRLEAPQRVSLASSSGYSPPWVRAPYGPLALPGDYTASLPVRQNGQVTELGAAQSFTVKPLNNSPEITNDREALLAFQQKTADLRRAVDGANGVISEMRSRISHLNAALVRTSASTEAQKQSLNAINAELRTVRTMMNGDRTIGSRNEATPMSISGRVGSIMFSHWRSQAPVTGGNQNAYEIAASEFAVALDRLRSIDQRLHVFEQELDQAGAPWTPGRVPTWKPE